MSNHPISSLNDKATVRVRVRRFDPHTDGQPPHWQDFDVPRGSVARLLDVLQYLQQEDPTIAIRPHYCRDLVCNGCYVNYNGKPRMSCMTPLNDRMTEITLEPLQGYRVIRDLVVDFLDKTGRISAAEAEADV
jgi:succinate dehydrogenase / fumarate reductase iron-sulfur subunit